MRSREDHPYTRITFSYNSFTYKKIYTKIREFYKINLIHRLTLSLIHFKYDSLPASIYFTNKGSGLISLHDNVEKMNKKADFIL